MSVRQRRVFEKSIGRSSRQPLANRAGQHAIELQKQVNLGRASIDPGDLEHPVALNTPPSPVPKVTGSTWPGAVVVANAAGPFASAHALCMRAMPRPMTPSCQRFGTPISRRHKGHGHALSFHFQIDRSLGAKPQTVQTHGKAKQQQILLIWSWKKTAIASSF